jgi:hypothetical protein
MLTVGLLVGTLSSVADAAVVVTPAVRASSTYTVCSIVNLSSQERGAVVELMGSNGIAFITERPTLPANGSYSMRVYASTQTQFHCRFTVPDVAKANLRGAIYNEALGVGFPAE